jgi:hypothetical protein
VTNTNPESSADLIDACCIGEGINGMTIDPIQVMSNTVTGAGELDVCCPYESVNDNSGSGVDNNTGNLTINPSPFGSITVSNNVVNSAAGLEFCCPYEGVNDLNVEGNRGTVTVGATTAGNITVSGPSAYVDVCCPDEGVVQSTVDELNGAAITFAPATIGAVTVSGNSLTTSSSENFSVCCATEDVGLVTQLSGGGGSVKVGKTTVGAVTIASNQVSGNELEVDGIDDNNGPAVAEGPISINGNQVVGSVSDGIALVRGTGYIGQGGRNPSVAVTGNTVSGSLGVGLDAPAIGSTGPITIAQNAVSNSGVADISIGQQFGTGLTLQSNQVTVNGEVGILAQIQAGEQAAATSAPGRNHPLRSAVGARRPAALQAKLRSVQNRIAAGRPSTGSSVAPSIASGSGVVVTQNSTTLNGPGLTAQDNTPSGTVTWYDPVAQLGNYWSDYVISQGGSDGDGDGIGDTPYTISGSAGSKDLFPLMQPPS